MVIRRQGGVIFLRVHKEVALQTLRKVLGL